MTDHPPNNASPPHDAAPVRLVTGLPPDRVAGTLQGLSKRGKLPGFELTGPTAFRLKAYGEPFDYWIEADIRLMSGSTQLDFQLRPAVKMPLVWAVVTVLTVQPGMWLTDSMLVTYFSSYGKYVQTWWWYLPLVVAPMPWMLWRMWRKSAAAARDHARELHERLAQALDARPEPGAATP